MCDWSSDVCSSDLEVGDPLVVCVLPRTGTTIVYDLLCLDPAARAPREWEWYIPWPAPEIETFATDPRIAQVQSIYENWLKHAPQLADIQRMDCTQPGECNHGMMLHFGSTNFRSEEHTSELQSLMRISYAVFCLKKKKHITARPRAQTNM